MNRGLNARGAHDNRVLRELMQRAGLRCSLPRLKILDALCDAGGLSAPELHARLLDCDVPITPSCVSQVLRRLHLSGLIQRDEQRRYLLASDDLDFDPSLDDKATRH